MTESTVIFAAQDESKIPRRHYQRSCMIFPTCFIMIDGFSATAFKSVCEDQGSPNNASSYLACLEQSPKGDMRLTIDVIHDAFFRVLINLRRSPEYLTRLRSLQGEICLLNPIEKGRSHGPR